MCGVCTLCAQSDSPRLRAGVMQTETARLVISEHCAVARADAATPGPLSLPTLLLRRWVDLLYEP
jgi:hypothetical protein